MEMIKNDLNGFTIDKENEEVVYKEEESAYYHIKYYLEDDSNYVVVATTRPETLFGDTAVAVNANDERYKDFIGKNVKLPLTNRLIPIITDEHADMTKGTGAVKITPASDPNDFEVGLRHNLKRIIITSIKWKKHKNIFSDRDIRNNTKIKKKGYEINGRRFKKTYKQ